MEAHEQPQPNPRPAVGARSAIWNYFEKVSQSEAVCRSCDSTLKTPTATTTTLINHLKRHKKLYAEFQGAVKASADSSQPSVVDVLRRKTALPESKRKALDLKIARMVALDLQPYAIVEDRGFKDLLTEAVPGYHPPSRTTLSRTLVPKLYDDTRERVRQELHKAFEDGMASLAFTSDIWTSRANESYISLTCHFLDTLFKLTRYNLSTSHFPGAHTATRIASILEGLVAEWDIPVNNFPVYVVTDNARNIRAAMHALPWFERTCFAHTLQLAINDAKEMTPGLSVLCKKARAIVGHYKHSPKAHDRLNCCQKKLNKPPLRVIQDVQTRWNSEVAMFSRLVELREAITIDLASEDEHIESFSATEWREMNEYVAALKPLEEATTTVGADSYPTLSALIPIIYCLHKHLSNAVTQQLATSAFAANLAKCLKTRFPNCKEGQAANLAMFLDPCFKLVVYQEDGTMSDWLKNLVVEGVQKICDLAQSAQGSHTLIDQEDVASTSALWKNFDTLVSQRQRSHPQAEVARYLQDVILGRKEDPCRWWREQGAKAYPLLAQLARRYLPIPATSVSSERLFSVSGAVISSRRACLLPGHVEQLTFLHDNMK